jgi:hypothetical protein
VVGLARQRPPCRNFPRRPRLPSAVWGLGVGRAQCGVICG